MAYRDGPEADQARIAALEAELATARERIAELEGRRDQALVLATPGAVAAGARARSSAARWLGAPLVLEMHRTFAGVLPGDRFEDLVVRIRELAREPGRAEILRSSLTWQATFGQSMSARTTITVVVRDGATTLTVNDRQHQIAGGLYGGLFGGLGGGGVMAPIGASMAVPALAPVFFVAWFGGVFAGTRALYRRVVRRRAELVQRLFDALGADLEAMLARSRESRE